MERIMKLKLETAEIFVPDGFPVPDALKRTTHMAVGAHQDDLEIMAFEGILACFQQDDQWFTGVVMTNGSGSPRDDVYKSYTDEDMRRIRAKEQKKAAVLGEYAAQVLLDYPSAAIKSGADKSPVEDLVLLLQAARPETVYTHNLADKHDTHVGVTLKVIEAIRCQNPGQRPKRLYGCEVWRDLDWMIDSDKVAFDSSDHENLQAALLGVYDSQVCGGKRYDLATMGRRRAHATYHESHGVDTTTGTIFAMDLTPLIEDEATDPAQYIQDYIQRFAQEVADRLAKLT
jgi:LmbE family N-acetylglucosaminyl deacetylase